ncbi:MAG: hypothetical protein ACT4QG_01510 [Sporichthyaceae bacterium]
MTVRRRRHCRDRGETLLELVMAVALMGSAGVVFLGVLAAAWLNAERQDGTERARTLASSIAELSSAESLRFEPCAGLGDYQPALDRMVDEREGYTEQTPPADRRYRLTVTEVVGWNGTGFVADGCDRATQRLQRVTVKAEGPGGAVQQIVFTKSRTTTDGSEAVVDATTTPATLGNFALSVSSPGSAPAPEGTVRFAVFAPSDPECRNALWQTLKDPADASANPSAKAVRAPRRALLQTGDLDFSDRRAEVTVPMFDIAAAYDDEPGTYRWRATYLGGAEVDPSSTPCGGPGREIPLEKAEIELPQLTVEPGGVAVYQSQLRLGNVVPGSIRLTLHGLAPGAPGDPCTTGQARELAPIQPAQDGAWAFRVDPSMYEDFGDYVLSAAYGGDVGHLPLRQECRDGQLLRVRAPSELGLRIDPLPEGPRLSAALVQGWQGQAGNPGLVTFRVFGTADCATPVPGVEATVAMNGGQATTTFAGLAPGDYWASAEWTGDARNVGDATSCRPMPVAGPPATPGDPLPPVPPVPPQLPVAYAPPPRQL